VDYKPETPATCRQNIFGSLEFEDNLECYKGNFEMYSPAGWNELQELTKTLNTGDVSKIGQVLDVDRTLWMHALNNVMVNLSSYSGSQSVNYFLYKDNTGRFQPTIWDLNLAFGSFKNTGDGSDLELRGLQDLDPLLHQKNPYKPLISQLLKDDFYKKIYLAHVKQINDEQFLSGAYEKRAQELQGMIAVAFTDDKYKLYSLDDFQRSLRETVGKKSRIPGIVELMARRTRFLKTHPDLSALPSAVSAVNVQGRGKFENQKLDAFKISARADRFPKRMILYYRLNEKAPFSALTMQDVMQTDLPSGVKAFSVLVEAKDPNTVLEYYLLVENAGAVSFMPMNYTQQPYKVKLSDLNK
jgi:CotH kinase protein